MLTGRHKRTRAKHDNRTDVGLVSTCADGRAGANWGPGTCEDDAAWEVAKRLGDGQRRRERARRVVVGPIYTRLWPLFPLIAAPNFVMTLGFTSMSTGNTRSRGATRRGEGKGPTGIFLGGTLSQYNKL